MNTETKSMVHFVEQQQLSEAHAQPSAVGGMCRPQLTSRAQLLWSWFGNCSFFP
ncbi:unnamed protein product, partial [Ectocarpus sp. 6 AP-2014]